MRRSPRCFGVRHSPRLLPPAASLLVPCLRQGSHGVPDPAPDAPGVVGGAEELPAFGEQG